MTVSMRLRLVWAFALVALVAMVLVIAGVNLGMRVSMGHSVSHGLSMAGHMGAEMMSLWALFQWSVGAGFVALAVAAATGWFMAARLAGPLGELAGAARLLGLRDLGVRVCEPDAPREVADLARDFNRMAAGLAAADGARRQMLADVAHELRHPVTAIQGQLELLQDGIRPLSPESLAPIQDEVLRLGRLIGDLQDLSLAEAGALALHREVVRPADLLEPLVASMEPVAEAKGITLAVAVDAEAPAVAADSHRLRQVLVNLLSNALFYTPTGGRVEVTARARDGQLELVVSDSGPGIDPDDLSHVFDRFYRADRSRSRQGGGSGLGLAIARSLVLLHGGTIEAQSEPGCGSRFAVRLPAAG